jgi:quinol monooxygenase YgiN
MTTGSLLIVQVDVQVKPESVDAFVSATLANARASLLEPGVARFDVVQDREDPTRFLLIEVYRSASAQGAHKETAHYQTWRDAVEAMMARPRTSRRFANVHPDDARWG